jgi:hypothetical protein
LLTHFDNGQGPGNFQNGPQMCAFIRLYGQQIIQSVLANGGISTAQAATAFAPMISSFSQYIGSGYTPGVAGAVYPPPPASVSVYPCPEFDALRTYLNVATTTAVAGGNVSGTGSNFVSSNLNLPGLVGQRITGSGTGSGSIFGSNTTINASGTTGTGSTSTTGGSVFTSTGTGTTATGTIGSSIAAQTGVGRSGTVTQGRYNFFTGSNTTAATGAGSTTSTSSGTASGNFGIGARGALVNNAQTESFFDSVGATANQQGSRRPASTIGSRFSRSLGADTVRGGTQLQDPGMPGITLVQ